MAKKKKTSPSKINYPVSQEKFPKIHPCASNGKRGGKKASGLMQVTHETVVFLKDEEGELSDHLLNIDKEDIADPNLNIAAGVRYSERTLTLEAWELLESFTRGSSDET